MSACSRQEDSNTNAKVSRTKPSKTFSRHPDFPNLPASVPLTYALTMTACLSEVPRERPTFQQLQQILSDLGDEVGRGFYINGQGRAQVCAPTTTEYLSEASSINTLA